MTNRATSKFWAAYAALPRDIRKLAQKNYALFRLDPQHPSLRLEKVGKKWSVRVGLKYRALAIETDDGFLWTWIGTNDQYDWLVKSL